jgi:hypothetical protein
MYIYYVYAYLREDNTPYYIGKGTKDRAWKHCKNDVIHPPTQKDRIIIVENNLSNIGALALERRLIRWYGRKDLGTGCLRNTTDGGDGSAGFRHTEEHKAYMSALLKGRSRPAHSPESHKKAGEKLKGRTLTEEHKNKLRGRELSDEVREKLKGRTPWNKGKSGIYSEETKELIRTARAKQVISAETKAKMTASQIARWAKKREAEAS